MVYAFLLSLRGCTIDPDDDGIVGGDVLRIVVVIGFVATVGVAIAGGNVCSVDGLVVVVDCVVIIVVGCGVGGCDGECGSVDRWWCTWFVCVLL